VRSWLFPFYGALKKRIEKNAFRQDYILLNPVLTREAYSIVLSHCHGLFGPALRDFSPMPVKIEAGGGGRERENLALE
jgi:hypothetical protein